MYSCCPTVHQFQNELLNTLSSNHPMEIMFRDKNHNPLASLFFLFLKKGEGDSRIETVALSSSAPLPDLGVET